MFSSHPTRSADRRVPKAPCKIDTACSCCISQSVAHASSVGACRAKQNEKADSTLRSSQAVPHPSTNQALRRLTSEVGRAPVHSTRYGRQLGLATQKPLNAASCAAACGHARASCSDVGRTRAGVGGGRGGTAHSRVLFCDSTRAHEPRRNVQQPLFRCPPNHRANRQVFTVDVWLESDLVAQKYIF